jgi:purine-nucleoside phosphorylase
LGSLAQALSDPLVIDFVEAGLPRASAPGHAGRLLAGTLAGMEVLVQQGRVHLYEGYDASEVTACVRLAAQWGATMLFVTNAAGGLRPDLAVGDLVLIRDHLNLTGVSPLTGRPAFIDMSAAYDAQLCALAHEAATAVGERLVEGVYAGVSGPAYETPAEARMLRTLGADVVGMSTVLEVIAARALGMRVLGCSLVSNVHSPHAVGTSHAEVLNVAEVAGPRLTAVLRTLLPKIAEISPGLP